MVEIWSFVAGLPSPKGYWRPGTMLALFFFSLFSYSSNNQAWLPTSAPLFIAHCCGIFAGGHSELRRTRTFKKHMGSAIMQHLRWVETTPKYCSSSHIVKSYRRIQRQSGILSSGLLAAPYTLKC